MERSAGILLPVFSLPGPYGIGSLGREARAFADFLHNAGQKWWQVLPVGPTGAGNSPYTSVSTFAGNPLLIDLEDLRDRGLLTEGELSAARAPERAAIDYAALYESREPLLRRAFSHLSGTEAQAVRDFAAAAPWLGSTPCTGPSRPISAMRPGTTGRTRPCAAATRRRWSPGGRRWRRTSPSTRRCSSGSSLNVEP